MTIALAAGPALAGCGPQVVRVEQSPLPASDARACRALLKALPDTVAGEPLRAVEPRGALAAGWGDPAIVLTCGVDRPEGFDRVSTCTSVNGVDWYIPEEQLEAEGDLVMTVVYRRQYVEVSLPADYWPPATALADLADAIDSALKKTGECV